jgi:protein-S-isoprenylcysteine O-methyltransferase Ste14
VVLLVFSSVLINWAMVVNPFFEPTVRIQDDREHRVVSSGPYAFVRHPGYLSGILWITSIPLILGSLYGLLPVGFYSVLMIIRTYLEDRTLKEELDGYREYSAKVRYRLFPGIW